MIIAASLIRLGDHRSSRYAGARSSARSATTRSLESHRTGGHLRVGLGRVPVGHEPGRLQMVLAVLSYSRGLRQEMIGDDAVRDRSLRRFSSSCRRLARLFRWPHGRAAAADINLTIAIAIAVIVSSVVQHPCAGSPLTWRRFTSRSSSILVRIASRRSSHRGDREALEPCASVVGHIFGGLVMVFLHLGSLCRIVRADPGKPILVILRSGGSLRCLSSAPSRRSSSCC